MTFEPILERPSEFLNSVTAGLMAENKSIDPKWLYDSTGSALFEEITALPEYYLTRTETQILKDNADMLSALVPDGGALVEFGSGASVKTRSLLTAGRHIGSYVPIDISEAFLLKTAEDLRRRYPRLTVAPVIGDFLNPVSFPHDVFTAPKIGFFPGSTLGNIPYEAARSLLRRARAWHGIEGFILGVDLVKDKTRLEAAYDDAQGVTEKFISNVLLRVNRELGADFDLSRFAYEAKWHAEAKSIEMSLVSKTAHVVTFGDHAVTFGAGEKILISRSRKFTAESLNAIAQSSGWRLDALRTDAMKDFAVAILKPANS